MFLGLASAITGGIGGRSLKRIMANTLVSNAQNNCFIAYFGSGVVTLTTDHNNVFTDVTCYAGVTDIVVADVGVGPLGNNGGPTIDAADDAACPATDQRGVARPQCGGCNIGAFELKP